MEYGINFDPGMAKFSPLSRVLTYDDFDLGLSGWMDLTPNFVREHLTQQPSALDLGAWGPVMLSSAPMRLTGNHGSMNGTYSLKLATCGPASRFEDRPAPGSMSIAIKRLTRLDSQANLAQIEAWYAYTATQDRDGTGEGALRGFGFFLDIQDEEYRWQPAVRYVNSINGTPVRKWQFGRVADGVTRRDWCLGLENGWEAPGVDAIWSGRRSADGSTDGFQWVPDGDQRLVYNESPDKLNWMYFRLLIDIDRREYVELQSIDRVFDLRGLSPTLSPRYDGITKLINPVFFVETDTDQVVNLYLDSVVYSTGAGSSDLGDLPC